MMTKIEDYVISPPPSDADIRGDIIPVADIENRTPCLRKEDYYYLRELYNVFQNGEYWKDNFESDYSFQNLLHSIFDLSNIYVNQDFGINWHLNEGMDASQFNGFKDISFNDAQKQIVDWLKNSNYILVFDDIPSSTILSLRKLDADMIRKCYRFLSQDMFRQVRNVSNGQFAFNYTLKEKSFEYQYPVLDGNGNVYYDTNTGSIVYNGFNIRLSGTEGRKRYIGMHRFQRSGNNGIEYYHSIAFPTSTITADVVFSSPVVEAYALLYLYSSGDWLPIIRPMTGSGLNWSVEILKRSDYDFINSGITVPILNEWVKTKAHVIEFNPFIKQIFARFENQYFALPSAWTWKPS